MNTSSPTTSSTTHHSTPVYASLARIGHNPSWRERRLHHQRSSFSSSTSRLSFIPWALASTTKLTRPHCKISSSEGVLRPSGCTFYCRGSSRTMQKENDFLSHETSMRCQSSSFGLTLCPPRHPTTIALYGKSISQGISLPKDFSQQVSQIRCGGRRT